MLILFKRIEFDVDAERKRLAKQQEATNVVRQQLEKPGFIPNVPPAPVNAVSPIAPSVPTVAQLGQQAMGQAPIAPPQTVEQVATASDNQLQRMGMGGAGLRERARNFLLNKNQKVSSSELEQTRTKLRELEAQMAMLLEQRKPGRPRKENVNDNDAGVSAASN